MEQCFVGLDVSKAETSIRVCNENGATVSAVKKVADPDVICQALRYASTEADMVDPAAFECSR